MEALRNVTPFSRFNYTATSRHARESFDSSWTAAIHDVGAGFADLAASDFWPTSSRAAISPFTIPIATDQITFWAPRPNKDESIWTIATGRSSSRFTGPSGSCAFLSPFWFHPSSSSYFFPTLKHGPLYAP
eukprot:478425-Prymnesium_polylepis.1